VDATTTTPATTPPGPSYDPERPVDRDNKPGQSVSTDRPGFQLTRSDHRLLKKTAAANEYEITISRQAATRASVPDVRSYAEMLVRDHETMNRELTALLARRGIMLRGERKYEDELAELSAKTGTNYDKAYLDDMIDAHEDGIRVLEKASKSEDTDVAALAVQYLPALRDHLARAQELAHSVD
jgi:putative membrane protein